MSQPKFFRADDDESEGERPKPAPGDWFGSADQKYRAKTPTFSEEAEGLDPHGTDGWRDFFQGHKRDPLWNPMLSPDKKKEANDLKFRDRDADRQNMIWVLEHAAEVFEAAGHYDLAAECETICELSYSED